MCDTATDKPTYLMSVCDTYDYTSYLVDIGPEDNFRCIYEEHNGRNMQSINTVYEVCNGTRRELSVDEIRDLLDRSDQTASLVEILRGQRPFRYELFLKPEHIEKISSEMGVAARHLNSLDVKEWLTKILNQRLGT